MTDNLLNISCANTLDGCNYIPSGSVMKLNEINPNTSRPYSSDEKKLILNTYARICNVKDGTMRYCCDPDAGINDMDTMKLVEEIKKIYPSARSNIQNGLLHSIEFTNVKKTGNGWKPLNPYMICKISKADVKPLEVNSEENPRNQNSKEQHYIATNLVHDCFSDNCENIDRDTTLDTIMNKARLESVKFSYMDDLRVVENIKNDASAKGEGEFLKNYIRKYNKLDHPLTHNDMRERLIHLVAQYGRDNLLDLLLALQADYTVKNKDGDTPLHLAAKYNKHRIMQKLLNLGASTQEKNNKGETPIFYSVQTGDIDGVNILYSNGADVLKLDNDGANLIQHAIKYASNKYDIISFLVDRGVPINDGKTNVFKLIEKMEKIIKTKDVGSNKIKHKTNNKINNKTTEHFDSVIKMKETDYSKNLIDLESVKSLLHEKVFKQINGDSQKLIYSNDLLGSPIKLIQEVCVPKYRSGGSGINGDNANNSVDSVASESNMIIGNEDKDACTKKGGEIVKYPQDPQSTNVVVSYDKRGESNIRKLNPKDLYYPLYGKKSRAIPEPEKVVNFNKKVRGEEEVVPEEENVIDQEELFYKRKSDSIKENEKITFTEAFRNTVRSLDKTESSMLLQELLVVIVLILISYLIRNN